MLVKWEKRKEAKITASVRARGESLVLDGVDEIHLINEAISPREASKGAPPVGTGWRGILIE